MAIFVLVIGNSNDMTTCFNSQLLNKAIFVCAVVVNFTYRFMQNCSVADPNPGSGAFLSLDPGSGIVFFGIPDPKPIFLIA
jgi:hypothetical protein